LSSLRSRFIHPSPNPSLKGRGILWLIPLGLLFISVCMLPAVAWAGAGEWQRDQDISVRLVSGVDGTGSGLHIPLGLEIELAEGWHTYYREPGPLGLPPKIDWGNSLSDAGNLQSADILYPAPISFGDPGFESFGYKEHVVLPLDAMLRVAGKPLAIDASLELLVCKTLCVPKKFSLSLGVPAGAANLSAEAGLIKEALANVPANERTIEIAGPDDVRDSPLTPVLPFAPLWTLVILAVMGGFILNLTPCVLPVLSLKILSLINHNGAGARVMRRSFLMTAAGIVFSFLVLAGVTVGLKAAGVAVGWGMQFQQPVFLVFLVVLLTLFTGNLWNLYDIQLPRFLADHLDSHHHPKLAGDFLTGAFATLLATPCTAPFLGVAVGFALAQGPREIFAIFAALGLGMSLPYLLFTLWPRLISFLPKPGAWMAYLKYFLGGLLALTAAWLVYVLASQVSLSSAAAIAVCMFGALAALSVQHRDPSPRAARVALGGFIVAAFLTALTSSAPVNGTEENVVWQSFDEKALDDYVRQGKTVFVDVTADWCVNCKVNKKFTLARREVTRCLFESPNVIAMRADFTNSDPVIADFLKRHGRFGIPFNAVFGPAQPRGVVLPELLTPGVVIENLQKANNTPAAC